MRDNNVPAMQRDARVREKKNSEISRKTCVTCFMPHQQSLSWIICIIYTYVNDAHIKFICALVTKKKNRKKHFKEMKNPFCNRFARLQLVRQNYRKIHRIDRLVGAFEVDDKVVYVLCKHIFLKKMTVFTLCIEPLYNCYVLQDIFSKYANHCPPADT